MSTDPGDRRLRRFMDFLRPVPELPPGFARAPQPVASSGWILPNPIRADDEGVVGVGADLAPGTLVDAYRRGAFPWPHEGVPLPWFSPDPRGVLPFDRVRLSRSLRRTLRQSGWVTTVDRAFAEVIAGCATRAPEQGTWITSGMARAYRRLHELGWAHSVEVWDGDHLVGGLYGVQVGAVFTGESMFHVAPDASKVALVDIADRFHDAGGDLVDVQLTTGHLRSLGAIDIARRRYLDVLRRARDRDVRLWLGARPVAALLTTARDP